MGEVGRFNIWQSGGGENEMDSSDLKERGFNPEKNLKFKKMQQWKLKIMFNNQKLNWKTQTNGHISFHIVSLSVCAWES